MLFAPLQCCVVFCCLLLSFFHTFFLRRVSVLEENWKRCVAEDGVLRFALLHTGLVWLCCIPGTWPYMVFSCPSLCVQGLLFCFSASCYYKPSALQFCLEHVLRLNKKAETHAICVFFKLNSICFFVFFNVCCLRRYNDNIVFNVFTRLLSRRNFLQHFTFGILC